MRYLVSYDVVDDRRRGKLARVLLDWGDRVQYSVFECELDTAELPVLMEEMAAEVDAGQDSLRVYPMCADCRGKVAVMGVQRRWAGEMEWVV